MMTMIPYSVFQWLFCVAVAMFGFGYSISAALSGQAYSISSISAWREINKWLNDRRRIRSVFVADDISKPAAVRRNVADTIIRNFYVAAAKYISLSR